jgi:Ni/Fe-hydrogenase 1 B-type cytochrome subunit
MSDATARSYRVWDAPTRWFHWINVLLVLVMALSGFFFMFREDFAVEGSEAKNALKALHVWIGYAFAANLLVRVVWGFAGNHFARWRQILPSAHTLREIGQDLRAMKARAPHAYLGHSPLGRVAITVMFALLLTMAASGLIRAGTDLYYPPFGPIVAAFVAGPGVDPAQITWRTERELTNDYRFGYINMVKSATGFAHTYGAYVLMLFIAVHVTGAILTETRQNSGAISAMFSGRKVLKVRPLDADSPKAGAPVGAQSPKRA